ncbi:MAG: hypothetical protein PG981_000043 [Wolbachia endosymbiont of Ctenocephalides orientis wCori]|nr:MAG: hypothetical protein PG981_000043 [Wolbachia endosymbiont of Ctenocephalides orientis wCori]
MTMFPLIILIAIGVPSIEEMIRDYGSGEK